MQKKIVIEVSKTGAVKIEGVGFSGPGCKQATAAFEKALGVVTESTNKPDYYEGDEKLSLNQ